LGSSRLVGTGSAGNGATDAGAWTPSPIGANLRPDNPPLSDRLPVMGLDDIMKAADREVHPRDRRRLWGAWTAKLRERV
jgi:hypothetical protein